MAGWEDLSPDQLIAIFYLAFLSVLIFSSSHIIGSFLNWMASRNIKFHINKEVAMHVAKELQKPSLFQMFKTRVGNLKEWWNKRQEAKNLY